MAVSKKLKAFVHKVSFNLKLCQLLLSPELIKLTSEIGCNLKVLIAESQRTVDRCGISLFSSCYFQQKLRNSVSVLTHMESNWRPSALLQKYHPANVLGNS